MLSHSECVDSSATVKFLEEKLYLWSPYNESVPSCSSPSRFIRLFYKCVPTGRRIFIVWEAHCETQENAAACSVSHSNSDCQHSCEGEHIRALRFY